MKIKIVYWEVGFNGLMLREVRDEIVNKFNVGLCMGMMVLECLW